MAPNVGWRIIPPRHEENAGNPDEQPEVQVPEPEVQTRTRKSGTRV